MRVPFGPSPNLYFRNEIIKLSFEKARKGLHFLLKTQPILLFFLRNNF